MSEPTATQRPYIMSAIYQLRPGCRDEETPDPLLLRRVKEV